MIYAKCKPMNGLSVSRTGGCQSVTKKVFDDLQPEPRQKMWQRFDIEDNVNKEFFSTRTVGEWKILLRRSESIVGKHPEQTSRQLVKQLLGLASLQRSGSRVARCAAVYGFYERDSHRPPSLLTGPRHL